MIFLHIIHLHLHYLFKLCIFLHLTYMTLEKREKLVRYTHLDPPFIQDRDWSATFAFHFARDTSVTELSGA